MSEPRFDILFAGETIGGADRNAVADNLGRLFKATPETVARLMGGGTHVLKRGADADTARKYESAMERAGARAILRECPGESVAPATAPSRDTQPPAPAPAPAVPARTMTADVAAPTAPAPATETAFSLAPGEQTCWHPTNVEPWRRWSWIHAGYRSPPCSWRPRKMIALLRRPLRTPHTSVSQRPARTCGRDSTRHRHRHRRTRPRCRSPQPAPGSGRRTRGHPCPCPTSRESHWPPRERRSGRSGPRENPSTPTSAAFHWRPSAADADAQPSAGRLTLTRSPGALSPSETAPPWSAITACTRLSPNPLPGCPLRLSSTR